MGGFGYYCNISGDGSKIVVSAYGASVSIAVYPFSQTGVVQVFEYTGSGEESTDSTYWSQYGPTVTGSPYGMWGRGVALNTDGTIVIASDHSRKRAMMFKYRKIAENEWKSESDNKYKNDVSGNICNPGTSWDADTYYWYQYGTTKIPATGGSSNDHFGQGISWGNHYVIFAGNEDDTIGNQWVPPGFDNIGESYSIWNVNFEPIIVDRHAQYEVASNINTSGHAFADVSLNHNLVVPGNITIVDGSANNYGAYTTFTNNDATAYFNVGKSASNVFNIVDKNNVGVYMASDGNSMTSTSDERLKTDIESLDDPTEKLMQLKPCTYKWKTQEDDKKHVGFIAQEVEEVMPELVNETTYPNGGSYKGVAMSDLIPYLIKSIQERQLKIDDLKRKYA